MRNLKSGFILSYISIFIQSIISILYTPVMLRLLGESNYGLLQLAVSTMSSLSILSFGFGSSYMRFYSQYKADNDNNAISVLNGMFTIIFISRFNFVAYRRRFYNDEHINSVRQINDRKRDKITENIARHNDRKPCVYISVQYIRFVYNRTRAFFISENSDYNIVTFKSHADFSFADYGTRCGFRCDLYDGDYRYKTALRYGVLYKKT